MFARAPNIISELFSIVFGISLQLGCKFFIYTFAPMIKKIKNINLTVLWFAGLMLFAHAVIPHDHHIDFNHEKYHNKSNSQDTPIHCFFFNDIISDNTTTEIYKITPEKSLNPFSYKENKFSFQNFGTYLKILFPKNNRTDNKIIFIENTSVRGSPLFV